MKPRFELPQRSGPQPATTRPSQTHRSPHTQISQNAPAEMQERLFLRAASLAGVSVGDSLVSVPGARAFHLDPALARGPAEAFQREPHPVSGTLMIWGPRNAEELDIVWRLVCESYAYATGPDSIP
jgi:hypothetical protein